MGFPSQPLDANGIPISTSYVPNDNFYAIAASARKKTDLTGNTSTAPVFETRVIEDLRSNLMYIASTGSRVTATNPNLIEGASLFNPLASGKTILLLSAKAVLASASNTLEVRWTTTDPAFATVQTPQSLSASATASVASATCAANSSSASVSVAGTVIDFVGGLLTTVELIPANLGLLFPAGAANGLALFTTVAAAGGIYAMTFRWIEY